MNKKTILITALWLILCSFTYPDNFVRAMKYVLKFEGGFTMIDPGGTNYGVMQHTYDAYRKNHKLTVKPVRNISIDEVYDLYYTDYYLKSGSDTLPAAIGFVHFDTSINCGVGQAAKFVRKVNMSPDKENALNYLSLRDQFYRWLAANKNKKRFLKGWLNRDNELRNIINQNYLK